MPALREIAARARQAIAPQPMQRLRSNRIGALFRLAANSQMRRKREGDDDKRRFDDEMRKLASVKSMLFVLQD